MPNRSTRRACPGADRGVAATRTDPVELRATPVPSANVLLIFSCAGRRPLERRWQRCPLKKQRKYSGHTRSGAPGRVPPPGPCPSASATGRRRSTRSTRIIGEDPCHFRVRRRRHAECRSERHPLKEQRKYSGRTHSDAPNRASLPGPRVGPVAADPRQSTRSARAGRTAIKRPIGIGGSQAISSCSSSVSRRRKPRLTRMVRTAASRTPNRRAALRICSGVGASRSTTLPRSCMGHSSVWAKAR